MSIPTEDLLFFKLKDLITEQSEGEWTDAQIFADALRFANALRPMLAASTPVGGWEEASRDEVLRLLRTINRECDIGRHEADVLSIIDRLAAPPPPSVSTDNGSRPQEAVPTEQAEPAVLADSRLWAIGAWLSAALDDPNVCDDMKTDIREWFDSNLHIRPTPQPADGCSSNEGAGE